MTQAATDTTSNSGPDLTAYQNYFSFTPMNNEAEKRKILIQTCTHCQKAHLTCDGGRPCQGCIKRDLGTTLFSPTSSVPFTPADQPIENSNFIDTSQLFNFSLTDFGFGSETTGLEYGIIGNMLVDQPQQQNKLVFSPPLQMSAKRDSTSSASSSTSTMTKSTLSTSRRKGNNGNTPEAVYNSVRKPFNYAEGFHYLIQYVTAR
ncbi:hypothetical protein BD770DRAFT_314777 [Pilaira anomala]|nr:hypothetical protein BD770DRAFT_314777 [Pilaira anomala]